MGNNMEKDEGQYVDRPPQAQSSPAVAGVEQTEDLSTHEKPRASLHSSRKPGRFGRFSLDNRRPPIDTNSSDEPVPTNKKERSLSVPIINGDAHQDDLQEPLPTHAPTNMQSSRQNAVRSSVEFDRRFDGPFARPSIALPRRKSDRQSEYQQRPLPESDVDASVEDHVIDATAPTGSTPELLEPEPPPLNYTLHTRKKAIFIFWSFIVFDSVVMPIALYFGLWYGVGPPAKDEVLSANAVFSIVTAAIGGASILEYFVRFWRLYKKTSTCRVIGARRWYLDLFHWNFSLAWIIVMFELIIGTCQDWPPIRLLAMPLSTMLFTFGTELLLVDAMRLFRVPAPMRMSSIPKGAQLRPCIYNVIEDVVAVDGSGGTPFREALNRRYEASHVFRAMLRHLGVFWAIGAEGTAVLCTALIFTVSDDAAYTIGWSVPFVWAGIWSMATIWYVKKLLKKEKVAWAEQAAKGTA